MWVVNANPNVGTESLWDASVMSDGYEFADRPEWQRRDDGFLEVRVQASVGEALIDQYPTLVAREEFEDEHDLSVAARSDTARGESSDGEPVLSIDSDMAHLASSGEKASQSAVVEGGDAASDASGGVDSGSDESSGEGVSRDNAPAVDSEAADSAGEARAVSEADTTTNPLYSDGDDSAASESNSSDDGDDEGSV